MMKGFGRLRDRGLIRLQERRFVLWKPRSHGSRGRSSRQCLSSGAGEARCGSRPASEVRDRPNARSLFQQAGPGDEPIIRLPKPPDFSVAGPAIVGRALCAHEVRWQRGQVQILPGKLTEMRMFLGAGIGLIPAWLSAIGRSVKTSPLSRCGAQLRRHGAGILLDLGKSCQALAAARRAH